MGLQSARLYALAERAFDRWWAVAQAQENWSSAADAAACSTRLALERDRPSAALAVGARALPQVLGRSRIDPNALARLFINLAKAAWFVGSDADMRAFADAAQSTVEHEAVDPLIRVHYGLVQAMVSIEDGDLTGAAAWLLQGLDVAQALGDPAAAALCQLNLSYVQVERREFDRAHVTLSKLLTPGSQQPELVDALVNGVHVALGREEVDEAGRLARRAVEAYCDAPSMLSPISVAYLFDALACYHAAVGAVRTAELLGATARDWFAVRNRQREVLRLERWIADLPRQAASRLGQGGGQVDPDLLYLGDLFAGAHKAPGGTMAQALAVSVHHLLRDIEPLAPPAPCEHAAFLQVLTPGERWFTGRSPVGRAAERLLAERDAPGRTGLNLLASYETLASRGTTWKESLRTFRRMGHDPHAIAALDRLYREATA
jgi:hypothetical protein